MTTESSTFITITSAIQRELKTESARGERHCIHILLGELLNLLGLTQQALLAFLQISKADLKILTTQFFEMTLGMAEADYPTGDDVTAMKSVQMAIQIAKVGG